MATTAAPDGVILDGVILDGVRGADGSPSQERLVRIAAMLRDAEQALPAGSGRPRRRGRERRTPRVRRAA
jgi:hypothetical protein